MAQTEQVIHLQGNEDIHALRTMVARAQAGRVLLVVPKGHPALRGLVRLRLLVRQANDAGKQLALVTHDGPVSRSAAQLNLSVFRSVAAGQRSQRWRGGEAALPQQGQRGAPASWRTGREGVRARRDQIGQGGDWGERVALLGLGLGVAVVLVAVFLLVLPSAEITLVPRQEPMSILVPVSANPNVDVVDYDNAVVPAATVQVTLEATQQIPTSGRKDVPDAPATGSVTFINQTGQDIPVPANTIVATTSATPVKFRTLDDAFVPAGVGSRATAAIEAVAPGLTGNVAALQINQIEGPAGVVLRVVNQQPTQGGTVKQVAVVTAADKEQLREQLLNRIRQEGAVELAERTPEDQFFIAETTAIETLTESFDRVVDEQAETLTLLLRVRASGTAVLRAPVERLAKRALIAQVPPSFQLLDEGFAVAPRAVEQVEGAVARVAFQVDGVTGARLDGSTVRTLVRGLPLEEAHGVLLQRLPLAADPSIAVQPDWWGRMPYLPLRIFVRVAALPVTQQR